MEAITKSSSHADRILSRLFAAQTDTVFSLSRNTTRGDVRAKVLRYPRMFHWVFGNFATLSVCSRKTSSTIVLVSSLCLWYYRFSSTALVRFFSSSSRCSCFRLSSSWISRHAVADVASRSASSRSSRFRVKRVQTCYYAISRSFYKSNAIFSTTIAWVFLSLNPLYIVYFLVESPSFECAEVELALRIARGQDRRGILVQQRRGPISTPSGKAT